MSFNKSNFPVRRKLWGALTFGAFLALFAWLFAQNPKPSKKSSTTSPKTASAELACQSSPPRRLAGSSVRPTEQGLIFPPTPRFSAAAVGDALNVRGPTYAATLCREQGLRIQPLMGNTAEINTAAALTVRLKSAARKSGDAWMRAESNVAADALCLAPDGSVEWPCGEDFLERWLPRGDGVEQLFILQKRPEGTGPLVVTCSLETRGLHPVSPAAGFSDVLFTTERTETSGRPVGLRYGRVLAHDADGQTIAAVPRLSADGRSVSFELPGNFLDTAAYPLTIDPLVGADFQIAPINGLGADSLTVAPGPSSNYLVVWNDYRDGASLPMLYGKIVTLSGLVSAEFAISDYEGLPDALGVQRVQAAHNGTDWLVVWSDYRSPGGGLRGAIINPLGALLGGRDFLIAKTSGKVAELPLVAFNGVDFVVGWHDLPAGKNQGTAVYAIRVSSGGIVGVAEALPASTVATPQQALYGLAAAPAVTGGDTLFAYQDAVETESVVRANRFSVAGVFSDTEGFVVFKTAVADGGYGLPLGVTYDGASWRILSGDDQRYDSRLWQHVINADGVVTAPTGVFAHMGLGPVGLPEDVRPAAFAGSDQWLLLRNQKESNILFRLLGKRVKFNGTDLDPEPFYVDAATAGLRRSAVAAHNSGIFLAVWLDGRDSATQPSSTAGAYGAIIQAAAPGNDGLALIPVISASPTSGEAPLTVSFSAAASAGTYDSLRWDFGDGASGTEASVSHTYKAQGTYQARLRLTKGFYSVIARETIRVGTGSGGGESDSIIGTPETNSDGMVSELFIRNAWLTVDFANANADAAYVGGVFDPFVLPDDVTGLAASVSIGSQEFGFTLDAAGAYRSPTDQTPAIRFIWKPTAKQFAFQLAKSSLKAALLDLGIGNVTVKPAIELILPVTVKVGSASVTAYVGLSWRSKQDVSGQGVFSFDKTGTKSSGCFFITKFKATEMRQPATGLMVHKIQIKGQCTRPGGAKYKEAATGQWTVKVGNYVTSIPVGVLRRESGTIKYVARQGVEGLRKMSVDINSGIFNLQLVKTPAEGDNGSGVPLAKSGSNIIAADLNLSLVFDLDGGQQLSAGRYIHIKRKNAKAKGWGPR
jgi:hypothetical protein